MKKILFKGSWMIHTMGETTVVVLILAAYHGFIFIHSFLVLFNMLASLKCPNVQEDSILYFDFHPRLYNVAILVVTMAELAINISISTHIFKNDCSMKDLLPNAVIKRRHRQNAIGFAGHFIHFVLEWLSFGFWQLAVKQIVPPWIGGISSLILFSGITSICTIAFSRPLQVELTLLFESCPASRAVINILHKLNTRSAGQKSEATDVILMKSNVRQL